MIFSIANDDGLEDPFEMELRQLQYFTRLYEEGSVTRAAKRLNIVQPALSMQIAKLEDEFGESLFVRTPKGMVPTDAAHRAYELFVPIIRDLMAAHEEITSRGSTVAGSVNFGIIAAVADNVVTSAIRQLVSAHPAVSASGTGGYTLKLVEEVRTDQLDFAIVTSTADSIRLPHIPVVHEDLMLVGSGVELPPTVDLHDIDDSTLVIPSKRHGLRTTVDQAAERVGVFLQPRIEFDDINLILDFLNHEGWTSILPMTAVNRSRGRLPLSVSRIENPTIPRKLICVHSPRRPLSKAAQRLIDLLIEGLRSNK